MQKSNIKPLAVVPRSGSMEICPYFTGKNGTIGALGKLTELHALVYHQRCGFDANFELYVAKELAEFIQNFDAQFDGFWLLRKSGSTLGSIAIDGHQRGAQGARLRFLIVAPEAQGHGAGRKLMQQAIDFCRNAELTQLFLWTTPALTEARNLYESFGFALSQEVNHEGWGASAVHQRFELTLSDRF